MSLNSLPNGTYSTVCKVFATLSCVSILIISTYHIITSKKHSFINCTRKVYLPMGLIFFAIYTIFNLTIEIFDDFHTPSFCGYSKYVAIPSYIAYKCLLYLILVHRVHEAFGDTQYKIINTTGMKVWISIIIFWSLLNVILIMFTVTVEFDENKVPKCHTDVFRPTLMAMALLDVVACVVNLYLFIKPVAKLSAAIVGPTNENNHIKQLKRVAIKQCTLSVVAVSTTLIAMILIAMFSMEQLFIGADINVSTLSIVLMYKWNDYLVTKICCICVKEREIESRLGTEVALQNGAKHVVVATNTNSHQFSSNKDTVTKQTDFETVTP